MTASATTASQSVLREKVCIAGPSGLLDGELAYPLGRARYACLLVNPHPFMGGRMENQLIAHLAKALAACGAVTLRFDYAGVGGSGGASVDVVQSMARFWETGHAPGDGRMIEDTRTARHWLGQAAALPLAVVGYSFGAYAATQVCDEGIEAVVLISPTITRHDFAQIAASARPKLVIYSDDDFATPVERISVWLDAVAPPRRSVCLPGAAHFFKGRIAEVATHCGAFFDDFITDEEGA